MKITIAQGAFAPIPPIEGGGVEKAWYELAIEFAKRGHEVLHISKSHGALADQETRLGVRYVRVRGENAPRTMAVRLMRDFRYSARARRVLEPGDILVTHSFWLPVLVRNAQTGKLYVHVARVPKGQMRLYAHAHRLQTVSRPIAEAICAEIPRLSSRVRHIPYPVPNCPDPLMVRTNATRQSLILYVGRIHPEKGLDMLVKAFCRLVANGLKDWRLMIIGPWETRLGGGGLEYYRALESLARTVGERVLFQPAVFDPRALSQYLLQARLFAYPSIAEKGETFGIAPLEAMAHGCPALVSKLACFGEFIRDGINGFVFDHRIADAAGELERALGALLANPDRLKRIGGLALEDAQEFTVSRVAEKYLNDFDELVRS